MDKEKKFLISVAQGVFSEATDEEILAQPCVQEALRKAYFANRTRVLDAWEDDTPFDKPMDWKPGRVRRDVNGDERAYAGTLLGEPMWGVHDHVEDTPGGEAEADAWLRAHGYVLLDEGICEQAGSTDGGELGDLLEDDAGDRS